MTNDWEPQNPYGLQDSYEVAKHGAFEEGAHAAQVKMFRDIEKHAQVVRMGKEGQIPMHVKVSLDYWRILP